MDVNGVGVRNGNFGGLAVAHGAAEVVLIPVPWDVTVSDGEGTWEGPEAIRAASPQIEFWDAYRERAWTQVVMLDEDVLGVRQKGREMREVARGVIAALEEGRDAVKAQVREVNGACEAMVKAVEAECRRWLKKGKVVGIVGGDHSTALGLYRALAGQGEAFGILHIDAHCDLRKAYEGFTYSHASVMYNVVKEKLAQTVTQVAVRDFCEEEVKFAKKQRVVQFTDRELVRRGATGETWEATCDAIVKTLPERVVISLDIDGLQPWLCPHTGTPVPGGLGYEECFYLCEAVCRSGRVIVGFDVTEVVPGKLDAAVGARAVYRLAALAAQHLTVKDAKVSQGTQRGTPVRHCERIREATQTQPMG